MQSPPGVGRPAAASVARLAAFGPTKSASAARGSVRDTRKGADIRTSQTKASALPARGERPPCHWTILSSKAIPAGARSAVASGDLPTELMRRAGVRVCTCGNWSAATFTISRVKTHRMWERNERFRTSERFTSSIVFGGYPSAVPVAAASTREFESFLRLVVRLGGSRTPSRMPLCLDRIEIGAPQSAMIGRFRPAAGI
jgi:hypothetical protein